MFNLTKGMLFIAILCATIQAPQAANAESSKDVAKDKRGNVLTSTNGNCVRTRWQEASDPCAPPAPPAVVETKQEIVATTKTLQKEQRTVYFNFDKADITPESAAKLDSLADALKADKEVKSASIVGYADRMGSDEYNEKLSQRRAKAVADTLAKEGYLNTSMAKTRWLGESVPVTDCSESKKRDEKIACLANDRRVEVEIEYYSK